MGSHKQLDRIERMIGRTLNKVDSLDSRVTVLENERRAAHVKFPAPNISDPDTPAPDPTDALIEAVRGMIADGRHVLRRDGSKVTLDKDEVYCIADELGVGHKAALELLHRAGVLLPSDETKFHYARSVRVPPDGEPTRAIVILIGGV